MCYPVECPKCHKTTWGGCGMHVDQVLAGVPRNQRCQGHEQEARSGGLLARLFGR